MANLAVNFGMHTEDRLVGGTSGAHRKLGKVQ